MPAPGRNKLLLWGGFTPRSIPGLALWLDASRLSLADGDPVGTWPDLSGNGRNAAQVTAAKKPTFKTAIQNGRPVVRFDGVDDVLSLANFMSAWTQGEAFIIFKRTVDPAAAGATSGLWRCDTSTDLSVVPYTDGVIYDAWGSTLRKTVGDPAQSLAAWNLYNVSSEAGAWSARLNSTSLFSTGTNTVGFSSVPTLGQSSNGAATFFYFIGDIAEVIFCSQAQSASTRAKILAYSQAKWGTP